MRTITLRDLPVDLVKAIRRRATEQGMSFNRALVGLLQESLGKSRQRRKRTVYRDLDALAGSW